MSSMTELGVNLDSLVRAMNETYRWSSTEDPDETVLEHIVKQAVIVQVLLSVEDQYGNRHNLDYFRLLQCAINHDMAEAIVGDTPLNKKTSQHQLEETVAYMELRNALFQQRASFCPLPIDQDPNIDPFTKDFWWCCERVSYVLYCLPRRYDVKNGTAFRRIAHIHLSDLRDFRYLFASIAWFLDHVIMDQGNAH